MSRDNVGKKKSVHATISHESFEILEYFAGSKEFNSKSAVVDAALKALKRLKEPQLEDSQKIWLRARDELNMILLGKTTFLSYLKGEFDVAYKNNLAVESIEWYLGKRKEEMTLEEFLEGLRGMWLVANKFHKIDIIKNRSASIQMTFYHDLNQDYSKYWAGYFENLLFENFGCFVESFLRNESFHLIIKEEKE